MHYLEAYDIIVETILEEYPNMEAIYVNNPFECSQYDLSTITVGCLFADNEKMNHRWRPKAEAQICDSFDIDHINLYSFDKNSSGHLLKFLHNGRMVYARPREGVECMERETLGMNERKALQVG